MFPIDSDVLEVSFFLYFFIFQSSLFFPPIAFFIWVLFPFVNALKVNQFSHKNWFTYFILRSVWKSVGFPTTTRTDYVVWKRWSPISLKSVKKKQRKNELKSRLHHLKIGFYIQIHFILYELRSPFILLISLISNYTQSIWFCMF